MQDKPSLDLALLERLLARVAPQKRVAEVMGTLTALATAPASPHPSEWLLTLTDDARFEDPTDARAFLTQVLEAYRQLDAHLQLEEQIGPDIGDPDAVRDWCRGYFRAARQDEVWSADTDAMRRLMPMALLAGELDRVGAPDASMHSDAMRTKWAGALSSLAATFYARWAERRAQAKPQSSSPS